MVLQKNNHSPPGPRGIIFDCDGTLADTMPLHWRAWQVISRRHGFALNEERFYSLGGVPSRDILKLLSAEQGIALDPLAVAREKEAEYLPLIAQVEPINTVVGTAREHYGRIPLAVASGGTRRVIEQVLEHLGIRQLFQAVVTTEDVVNQKPAPDIFLSSKALGFGLLLSGSVRGRPRPRQARILLAARLPGRTLRTLSGQRGES